MLDDELTLFEFAAPSSGHPLSSDLRTRVSSMLKSPSRKIDLKGLECSGEADDFEATLVHQSSELLPSTCQNKTKSRVQLDID